MEFIFIKKFKIIKMKFTNLMQLFFLMIFIISFVLIVLCLYLSREVDYNMIVVKQQIPISKNIPLIVHLIYSDKSKIPQKVYINLGKHTKDYVVKIYDDKDGHQIIKDNFSDTVLYQFVNLKGAHKADLLRYCILYLYGGIYLDIKTELIKPVSEIFTNDKYLYTVLCNDPADGIYQGVIATRAGHPIFLDLINYIVQKPLLLPKIWYSAYTHNFYDLVRKQIGKIPIPGDNGDYYLFKEICTNNANDCYDGLDRYKKCCYIYDKNKKIIKTRYADYPWK